MRRHPLPRPMQFLLAPRTMRRISLWMIDHELTFEQARQWNATWVRYRGHLRRTYGRRWRHTAPADQRTLARVRFFNPRQLPEGTPGHR